MKTSTKLTIAAVLGLGWWGLIPLYAPTDWICIIGFTLGVGQPFLCLFWAGFMLTEESIANYSEHNRNP